jgi:hypothetical protein
MSREVAILRCIPILVTATTDRHDLQRTVLLHPLLDQVNCVGRPRLPIGELTMTMAQPKILI